MQRRMLTIHDRVEIGAGLMAKLTVRKIAEGIGRSPSVVSREIRRNQTKTRGYKIVTADCSAERRRSRPQPGKVATDPVLQARVLADLGRSCTPRQIAGRLQREATDVTVDTMNGSPDAEGRTVSHEAIYQYISRSPRANSPSTASCCAPNVPTARPEKSRVSGAHRSGAWCRSMTGRQVLMTVGFPGTGKAISLLARAVSPPRSRSWSARPGS